MGIIEDLQNMRQNMKQKAIEEKRNGMKDARILVNKRTYEMLSKKKLTNECGLYQILRKTENA